jgi:hypothetical protein
MNKIMQETINQRGGVEGEEQFEQIMKSLGIEQSDIKKNTTNHPIYDYSIKSLKWYVQIKTRITGIRYPTMTNEAKEQLIILSEKYNYTPILFQQQLGSVKYYITNLKTKKKIKLNDIQNMLTLHNFTFIELIDE